MSKMQGNLIKTNDDGSMTIYLCKKYNTFADILRDENPPQYALCADTGIYYKRNDDGTWPEAVEALQWTYSEVEQGQNPSITLHPGLLTNPLQVILTDTASDIKGNTIGWASPDWIPENIVQGKNIFGIAGLAQASAFGISKVHEFKAYRAEMTDVSQVVISGLGFFQFDPEYDPEWGTDLAPLNGTYVVTEDTQYNTHQNRVYKQVDGQYLLAFYKAQEYDDFYDHWFISKSLSWHGYSANITCSTDTLANAAARTWEVDPMMGAGAVNVPMTLTQTTYPEQQFKLTGYDLTEYDIVKKIPTVSDNLVIFTDTLMTPSNGSFCIRKGSTLVGKVDMPDSTFIIPDVLFAVDASQGVNELISGNAPTTLGSGTILQNGEFCFDNTRALTYQIGSTLSALKDFTIEMDFTITSDTTGMRGMFGNKTSWSANFVSLEWARYGYLISLHWNGFVDGMYQEDSHPGWVSDGVYHHAALVRKGEVVSIYTDGKLTGQGKYSEALNLAIENMLDIGTQRANEEWFPGRMKHFRITNKALYTGDFSESIPAWVGMDTSGSYTDKKK